MEYSDIRCLVHIAKINTKNVKKGEYKLCFSAYQNDNCRCDNCLKYTNLRVSDFYASNKEKLSKQYKQYYDNNKKQIIDNVKKNYYKNHETRLQYSREYKKKHPNQRKEWRKKNIKRTREQGVLEASRRRARIRNNAYEKYTISDVLARYGDNCYLCGLKIDLSASRKVGVKGWEKGLHIEHVVDIAKGGPDTLHNVRPSHGICNLTKKPTEMV